MTDIPPQAYRPHPWLLQGRWILPKDGGMGFSRGLGFEYILRYIEPATGRIIERAFRNGMRLYSGPHDLKVTVEMINEWLWRVAPWA